MTPEQRYRELSELTERFTRKPMIRHHFIRLIREAEDAIREEYRKLSEEQNK